MYRSRTPGFRKFRALSFKKMLWTWSVTAYKLAFAGRGIASFSHPASQGRLLFAEFSPDGGDGDGGESGDGGDDPL